MKKVKWTKDLTLFLIGIVLLNVFPLLGVALYYEDPLRFIGISAVQIYGIGWIFNIGVMVVIVGYYIIINCLDSNTKLEGLTLDMIFVLFSLLFSFILVSFFVNRLF